MNPPDELFPLDDLQEWMQQTMIGAGSEDSSRRIEEVILPSKQLTAEQRLQIYATAYHARLLECLGEEFATIRSVLGESAFAALARGYLQQSPSQSYTLNELGKNFPGFLRETRPARQTNEPDEIDFLIDLATVERTYSEVFDGAGGEGLPTLNGEILSTQTVERWLQSRVKVVPSLRFLELQFPVHEFITARRTDAESSLPEPSPTWLVVTRRDYIVRRVAVPEEEFLLLRDLATGEVIGAALQRASERSSHPESLPAKVQHWFTAWGTAGYFLGLES